MKKLIAGAGILFLSLNTNAQIQLPKGFACIKADGAGSKEGIFTNGTFTFSADVHSADGPMLMTAARELAQARYSNKLVFKPTKDGLLWATGKIDSKYYYIVISGNGMREHSISSYVNNAQFSNYSTWLLIEVRKSISAKRDNFFTDYKGESCIGF